MHPSDDDVRQLADYAEREQQLAVARERVALLEATQEATSAKLLPGLREIGAVVIPASGGEFTVRRNKDEDGESIEVSFQPQQPLVGA